MDVQEISDEELPSVHLERMKADIKTLYEQGKSVPSIGKQFGLTNNQIRYLATKRGWKRPANSESENETQSLSSENAITDDMSQRTESPDASIALMRRDIDDLRKSLDSATITDREILKTLGDVTAKLKDMNKQPLAIVEHGDKLDVNCPNCGTTGTFQVKTTPIKTFDDVLAQFEQPHENGADALMCKNCRPKIDALLQKHGLKLTEAKK
jgi:hypothetical protein